MQAAAVGQNAPAIVLIIIMMPIEDYSGLVCSVVTFLPTVVTFLPTVR
jgi:hypothetical protein